jgi:hypothetical protein
MIERRFDASRALPPGQTALRAKVREERRAVRTWVVATGTLACPHCDAPVDPGDAPLRPGDALECPFCSHRAATREFLSLAEPTRPARVDVRLLLNLPTG